MPVYRIGDLVQVKDDDSDVIGLIIEMRTRGFGVKVKWSDLPEPYWMSIESIRLLEPMRAEQSCVTIEKQGGMNAWDH